MGGPWDVVEGRDAVGRGEIIVDRGFARRAGVAIGDAVGVLGGRGTNRRPVTRDGQPRQLRRVRVVRRLPRRCGAAHPSSASSSSASHPVPLPKQWRPTIERAVPGVTAQSRADFVAQERRIVTDMSADVIAIMNVIGFVVALAVVALTVYVATLARRREFGVLKALGARNRVLYRVVLAQACLSVAVGFVIGLAFTALLGLATSRTDLNLELVDHVGDRSSRSGCSPPSSPASPRSCRSARSPVSTRPSSSGEEPAHDRLHPRRP